MDIAALSMGLSQMKVAQETRTICKSSYWSQYRY